MSGFTPDVIPDRGTLLPTCLVVLACFCFGTIPYFAKSLTDSGMASYAVAFYRYGLSALVSGSDSSAPSKPYRSQRSGYCT
jgi:hypothetical protein